MFKRISIGALLCVFSFLRVSAHEASDSYLTAKDSGNLVTVSWDIAVRDLDFLIGLDTNLDGDLTWGEIRLNYEAIETMAYDGLKLFRGSAHCIFSPSDMAITDHNDEAYVALQFVASCMETTEPLRLEYDFMFDTDPSHRGIMRMVNASGAEALAVVSPDSRSITFEPHTIFSTFSSFVTSGFDHILEGYDHILFLIVLVFSVVRDHGVFGGNSRRPYVETLKLLTAFTIAHAITISLAQTGIVVVSGQLVESVIALSIVIAAIDNFRPFLGEKKWLFAFGFGLIHGLGFAGALGPLLLEGSQLAFALIGFNVGVELGQILIASVVVSFLMVGINNHAIRVKLVLVGSFAAFFAGMFWFVDRSIGVI